MRSYGSLSGHAQKVVLLIYVSLIPMVLTLGNESLLMMFLPGTSESGLTFQDFSTPSFSSRSFALLSFNIQFYYINSIEIPSELFRENFIFSHVKIRYFIC